MPFQINMNPLVQSSQNVGNAFASAGQSIADAMQSNKQQDLQAQQQELMQQALGGNPQALEQVYAMDPDTGMKIAQKLQGDMEAERAGQEQFKSQMAQDTSDAVEKLHLAPDDKKEAIFQAMVDDERYDIDEEDRPYFMDEGARRALVGKVKGKEYADSFFGEQDKTLTEGKKADIAVKREAIQQRRDALMEKTRLGKKVGAKDRRAINKDFTTLISDSVDTYKAAKSLSKLNEKSTPTDQLAAIFKFMKSLDPTSVVREGEQQLAKRTGGPVDAFVGYINQLQGEGGLTPTAFGNMVNTAISLSDSAIETAQTEAGSYLDSYEDTLPEKYKELLRKRIPSRIGEGGAGDKDISQATQTATGPNGEKLYLINNKWVKK